MRILFDGKVKLAETITATNSSINYPATNIGHPWLARRFQSTSTSSVITITLDDEYDIDCFFYGLHNLTALTAVFKNLGGSTIGTIVVSDINDIGREYFTAIPDVKSIELTISVSSGNAYIGGFEVGEYYQMPDIINNFPLGLRDPSLRRKSRGGQITGDKIRPLRNYNFKFREILKDQVDEMLENYITAGKEPIFMDITEGDRDYLPPIYCEILEPFEPLKSNRRFTDSLKIEEAR